ncbi:MAG: hypothetical protein EHM28_08115 [Spirochaetaceae bacterium]|nr:MAG: hypothetical protein EHM28_08115 [Spirochaetaceae bacterium]
MDIFNYALQFEQDGERYYREGASKLTDDNLKKILLFLAEEERKHYYWIRDFKSSSGKRPSSIFISDIQNIFSTMRQKGEYFTDDLGAVTIVLEKAMELEKQSMKYYESKGREVNDPDTKNLLEALRKQEDAHFVLLASIVEYYEKPSLWIENAEFNHLDEY